jgi:hypothetical protein
VLKYSVASARIRKMPGSANSAGSSTPVDVLPAAARNVQAPVARLAVWQAIAGAQRVELPVAHRLRGTSGVVGADGDRLDAALSEFLDEAIQFADVRPADRAMQPAVEDDQREMPWPAVGQAEAAMGHGVDRQRGNGQAGNESHAISRTKVKASCRPPTRHGIRCVGQQGLVHYTRIADPCQTPRRLT